jgi:hypothetical protein
MLGLSPSKIQSKVKGFIDPKLTTIQKKIIKDNMKKGRQDDNRLQV